MATVKEDELYIFWFLHQTTTYYLSCMDTICCISFDSYIKPQLASEYGPVTYVVYLLIPTSNHNRQPVWDWDREVVYLLIPTSNHNPMSITTSTALVVYLLIPTSNHNEMPYISYSALLYIFWFLHQTTTSTVHNHSVRSCISFDSYIKPQLWCLCSSYVLVVYLLIPTSNHNFARLPKVLSTVVYLLIPTSNHNLVMQS